MTIQDNSMRKDTRDAGTLIVVVAGSLYVAARLWRLTSYGLFGDEVFTLWTSAQGWRSLLAWVIEDVVHPPLFYALLKLWIDVGGQSLLWIKLLPALLSIFSLIPLFLLCRELRVNRTATGLALWLMAVNGFLIGHAQESRMYSLLLLLVLFSIWLFVKLQNSGARAGRVQFALGVVNLLLVFTHYFGWVIVALELAYLVLRRSALVTRFALSVLAIALCFTPWAVVVMGAARANPSRATFYWNRPPPLSELVGYYANLNGALSYRWRVFGTGAVTLLFLLPIIMKCVRVLRTGSSARDASRFWLLMLFAFVPVAIAYVASHLLPQPVWAFRYLIIAAPAYFLLVATTVEEMRGSRTGTALLVFVAAWAGLSGFAEMFNRDLVSWQPLVSRMVRVERALSRDEAGADPHVKVFVADPNVGNTVQFYLDQAGEASLRVAAVEDLRSPPGGHSWVALIRYNHETQPPLQDVLAHAGYRIGEPIEAAAAGHRAVLFPVWKPR